MSYRGSFVTEYIYCKKCLAAAKKELLFSDECMVLSNKFGTLPIIAGLVKETFVGGELQIFENIVQDLQANICHPMRIVVLAEVGEEIFTISPGTARARA